MKRGDVAIARGNHRLGYKGLLVIYDDAGRETVVVPECGHRHATTAAARTCAVLRKERT